MKLFCVFNVFDALLGAINITDLHGLLNTDDQIFSCMANLLHGKSYCCEHILAHTNCAPNESIASTDTMTHERKVVAGSDRQKLRLT